MAEELEHEPQPQEPRTELPEEGAAPADGAEPEKKEKKPSEDLFYWLNALTTALVSLVLVFTFIGRLTRVQGESMTNTLQDQQLLLVWSLGYEPKQGDIVVLNKTTVEHLGGVAIVKRVIATGGQTVDIDYESNSVYVDGVLLDEPYIREPMDDITADPNRPRPTLRSRRGRSLSWATTATTPMTAGTSVSAPSTRTIFWARRCSPSCPLIPSVPYKNPGPGT